MPQQTSALEVLVLCNVHCELRAWLEGAVWRLVTTWSVDIKQWPYREAETLTGDGSERSELFGPRKRPLLESVWRGEVRRARMSSGGHREAASSAWRVEREGIGRISHNYISWSIEFVVLLHLKQFYTWSQILVKVGIEFYDYVLYFPQGQNVCNVGLQCTY
jgi:hypothetical protein